MPGNPEVGGARPARTENARAKHRAACGSRCSVWKSTLAAWDACDGPACDEDRRRSASCTSNAVPPPLDCAAREHAAAAPAAARLMTSLSTWAIASCRAKRCRSSATSTAHDVAELSNVSRQTEPGCLRVLSPMQSCMHDGYDPARASACSGLLVYRSLFSSTKGRAAVEARSPRDGSSAAKLLSRGCICRPGMHRPPRGCLERCRLSRGT